jgi:peptide/nickel transport system permease protein
MTFWSIVRQRCWGLLLVVAGVCIITFIISHLIPGDPARLLAGDRASDEIVQNIRQQLGLDQPLYIQFGRYVDALAHGDLGTSIRTGRPVAEDLKAFFPATLELAFCSLLLALVIGVPLGILSAVYRNRWLDHLVRLMAMTGISTPAFWLGLGVIVLFYGHLQILPGGGRLDDWLDPPTHVTGFYLLDALLEGNGEVFFNALQHLILPSLTLAFVHLGIVARQVRSAMLEQLSEDYIRTARQRPARLVHRPALRPAECDDPVDYRARAGAGRSAVRRRADRNRLCLAGHGRLGGDVHSGARFPCRDGLCRRRFAGLRAG